MSNTIPLWEETAQMPQFPPLASDLRVEVLVIGGGITGISTAYLLKKAGRSVALIDRGDLARRDTGHTTAHVTCVTDTRLRELVRTFGRDHARAAWEAGWAAIEQIQGVVRDEQIACEFARVPAYLHAPLDAAAEEEVAALREDAELATQMGFDAAYLPEVPVVKQPGVRFSNQAKFHPLKYLAGLLRSIPGENCHVFEHTEAVEFHDEPLRIVANGRSIHCERAVLATHVPLQGTHHVLGAALLQTKLALYSTYAIGARLPEGTAPEASFWDTADPYNYLRIDQRDSGEYAILGGADHKTGQESDTERNYRALEEHLLRLFPQAIIDHRWSGQVIETPDGLPYIGETTPRQFIATGFAGNGMTFGTLAGIMARDAITGVKNPWRELFDPHRKKLRAVVDYLRENKDYPFYLVRDRLRGAEDGGLAELQPGEGKIVRAGGKKVAAYRDEEGKVTSLSPVCTHLGCIVHWNAAEKTWDCPCHGSRFGPNGEPIGGPAESPLEPA
jgi:glycine/D-amino acid oxidase-like deaminating enzyme/nitrite reductase/ring-hydroxylating ferredoxin subunit